MTSNKKKKRSTKSSSNPNDPHQHLHRTVRIALAEAGLSQTELAARIRVPPTSLSDWLRGLRPMPQVVRTVLENELGIDLGAFSGRTP